MDNPDGDVISPSLQQLQQQASRAVLVEQRLRETIHQLEGRTHLFTQMQNAAMAAFHADSTQALYDIIAEGMVETFQMECAGLFRVNMLDGRLEGIGLCNLPLPGFPGINEEAGLWLDLPRQWLTPQGQRLASAYAGACESPVTSPTWLALGLGNVVAVPLFDNEHVLSAVLVGGVSQDMVKFFDFDPVDARDSCTVYGQLLGSILNNRDALERANQSVIAKARFLANMSHEIRTPMNAITGMAQLAVRSDKLEDLKGYVSQIHQAARHLMGMLNSVLDISKIDEGRLDLHNEPFLLQQLVRDISSVFASTAAERGQSFILNSHGLEDMIVVGDIMRLRQVLYNLLGNAVKFTPTGGSITLGIEDAGREASAILLRFSVTDTGRGISEEAISHLFNPFEQEDASIARDYGGTGLGLAVCQRIVKLMGGVIKVRSKLGEGSCFDFHILLPIFGEAGAEEQVIEEQEEKDAVPDFSAYRVLITDDIDINREIAAALLEETGIACDQAGDGEEAINMFVQSPPGYYTFILMDLQMPGCNGLVATRTIRSSAHPDAQSVIIIAMTGNVFADDVSAALEAGMNGYIAKPVEQGIMLSTMAKMLKRA